MEKLNKYQIASLFKKHFDKNDNIFNHIELEDKQTDNFIFIYGHGKLDREKYYSHYKLVINKTNDSIIYKEYMRNDVELFSIESLKQHAINNLNYILTNLINE